MKLKITFLPKGKKVAIQRGESILQGALKNRIAIPHRCGGNGSCTTCKIRVSSKNAFVSDPSMSERKMVGDQLLDEGIRLACQTRVYGDIEVELLEQAWKRKVQDILDQQNKTNEGI